MVCGFVFHVLDLRFDSDVKYFRSRVGDRGEQFSRTHAMRIKLLT